LHTLFAGDLLDEKTAIVDGYNSYFSFSRGRGGYSGKAAYYITFIKIMSAKLL